MISIFSHIAEVMMRTRFFQTFITNFEIIIVYDNCANLILCNSLSIVDDTKLCYGSKKIKSANAILYGGATKFYTWLYNLWIVSNVKHFDKLYTTNNYEFGVDGFYLCKLRKKNLLPRNISCNFIQYKISTILLDAICWN